MPRLIDADVLAQMPWVLPNRMTRETALECFRNIVNDAPTIDAVEVVRCKDCRWVYYENDAVHCCTLHKGLAMISPDSFCSYGKRRGNDAID